MSEPQSEEQWVANDELHAAIERGDVRAVDRALQSGVSPDSEIVVGRDDEGWRAYRSLLYLAAEVHSFGVHLRSFFFLIILCAIVRSKRRG